MSAVGGARDFEMLEGALRTLLVERGVVTEREIAERIAFLHERTPAIGAHVVARAWRDPEFKNRLLDDAGAALREIGVATGSLKLVVVENTTEVHNVVVCTLCSCYPRMLLGMAPDWYKSIEYRARVVREPRAVLAEFGLSLDDGVAVRVHDSTAELRYLVLPMRPANSEHLSEDQCAALVSRDAMIGTAVVRR